MRVLITADAVGGVFTFALELAGALAARGVEVVLATEGATLTPAQRAAVAAIPAIRSYEGAFRLEWMPDPWSDVAAAGEWLLEIARRENPNVVHLNAYAHGALPFRAPKVVVGHSCVLSWWEAVKGEPAPQKEWARYAASVRAGLAGADAVVAPSAAMLRALERHYGSLRGARVIPNGRSASRYRPGVKEPIVFAAGRVWDEAKNVAAVARVAPLLPWPVFVAGEGAEPGNGPGSARTSPLSPRSAGGEGKSEGGTAEIGFRPATFLGHLPERDLADWLSRAAIFAHPARYEPFGLAVLEAALSGCALVLGDLASLRENWNGAALFVPPSDDGALRAAVAALAEGADRRTALAARARARALELGADRMVDRYLALYRQLGKA